MMVSPREARMLRSGSAGALLLALWVVLAPAAAPSSAHATPDWRTRREAGALVVYADDKVPNRWYYAPREIEVATTAEGAPDFRFLETRYTGSAVSKDRGAMMHRSLVTVRVRLPRVSAEELAAAARALGGAGAPADLRPYPVRKMATALVYASIGDTVALRGGRFEAEGEAGEGFWTERIYTLGLDSLTSQAFRGALEKNQTYLSLGYAFLGDAVGGGEQPAVLTGSPELVAELSAAVGSERAGRDSVAADSIRLHVLRAGAITIDLDARRYPDLLRRVDLNERAPPGYAALDVYCYDFNNDLRPDLAEKQVEIEAESVGGKRVKIRAAFRRDQSDLYASSIRFPVAVRIDRPYRYRVNEVKQDGMSRVGPWREVVSWSQILDVTTPPKSAGVRSVLGP